MAPELKHPRSSHRVAVWLTVAALTDGSYVDEFFLDDDKIDIYLYSESGRDLALDPRAPAARRADRPGLRGAPRRGVPAPRPGRER